VLLAVEFVEVLRGKFAEKLFCIMQISGHKNVASINNYSTLSEERHKNISNILSNTESETNRKAFQQTYLVKPPQILQSVALLMTERLIIYLNKLN
jgi:hypothetical protein